MSRWVEGRCYDYGNTPVLCVRRWFDGPLEMVDLAHLQAAVVGGEAKHETFTRTARALAPCVIPRVTATLGGVTVPGSCEHAQYPRVMADAGPNAGHVCCEACGTRLP